MCTSCRTSTRCCPLAGTAEGSIVFTRFRQCAHATNTLFLEPARVSPLNGISIGSTVFALLIHWCRPRGKGATFGSACIGPSPSRTDRSIVYLQASKSTRKSTPYIIFHSISTILHYKTKIRITRDPPIPIAKINIIWDLPLHILQKVHLL